MNERAGVVDGRRDIYRYRRNGCIGPAPYYTQKRRQFCRDLAGNGFAIQLLPMPQYPDCATRGSAQHWLAGLQSVAVHIELSRCGSPCLPLATIEQAVPKAYEMGVLRLLGVPTDQGLVQS